MRTLKKTLCLVLALVMVLGVCAVGASAAEFTDADEINYAEAVAVLSGIGVINGIENEDGSYSFQPTGTLTRAQAAKIIAYLLRADESELSSKSTFADCQGHWADGPIAYCAAKGIVAGVGDGNYNPDGKLTGFAFAKMLLCAIGYNAQNEGMVGETWSIAVASLAKKTNLLDGIAKFDGNAECSREQACQLAYNATKARLVEYATSGTTITTGDVTITTGASAATEAGGSLAESVYDFGVVDPSPSKYDAYGRRVAYEVINKETNEVLYTAISPVDYTYFNNTGVYQDEDDVAAAYAKEAGLKASDISISSLSICPGETIEFIVSPDKKDLIYLTEYEPCFYRVKEIKDTADTGVEYKKDIVVEYYGGSSTWTLHEDELTIDVKVGDYIALQNDEEELAEVLEVKQGKITAYNSTTETITIGGEKLVMDDDYELFDGAATNDFASDMFYCVYQGMLAVIAIDVPAAPEYETKIGYAISCQSVAYAAASTGDLLGAGASASKDGRAVVEILDMDGKVTVYDIAVKTDAKAGKTSYTGADSYLTGDVATYAKAPVDEFVEYYVNEDGTIVVVALYAPASVSTVKATVAVGSDKANSATVIKTVGDAASKYATAEITGYKNFVDATYATAYVTYTEDGYIDTIYAVDVPAAAPAPVAPVIAYCKTIGDLTAKGYEVTFVVDGKEVVYLDAGSVVAEGKYYELVVADGAVDAATAEATPSTAAAEIAVVDAGYIDTDAGVIEFAKTTATYDISGKSITELAKGVVVDVFNLADGSQIIFIVGKA